MDDWPKDELDEELDEDPLGNVENLIGANVLVGFWLRDMYIWAEGELETAPKDN